MTTRAEYTYELPAKLQQTLGVKTLTLVELNAEEEMMATKRSRNDPVRLAWELPKEALRAINGARVGSVDGSIDKAWNDMHPKVRALVMQAYNDLHNPVQTDVADFLASRAVSV